MTKGGERAWRTMQQCYRYIVSSIMDSFSEGSTYPSPVISSCCSRSNNALMMVLTTLNLTSL